MRSTISFSKECAKGYYGDGCSEVCGHCVDQNDCHHINGTCFNGCKEGYMGNLCKTGMYAEYVFLSAGCLSSLILDGSLWQKKGSQTWICKSTLLT